MNWLKMDGVIVLEKMGRGSFFEEVIFAVRFEWWDGISYIKIWGNILGRKDSKCKS